MASNPVAVRLTDPLKARIRTLAELEAGNDTIEPPRATPDASPDLVRTGAGRHPAFASLPRRRGTAPPGAVKAIRDGMKFLSMQPQVGRVVEDMDEAFRDWPADFGNSGYVVRYRFVGELVTILSVRHQKEAGG